MCICNPYLKLSTYSVFEPWLVVIKSALFKSSHMCPDAQNILIRVINNIKNRETIKICLSIPCSSHKINLRLVKYHLIIVIKFKKQNNFSAYTSAFSIIKKICEWLRSKVDQFVENNRDKIHEILLKYQKNIDRIKTIGQLEQLLYYTPKRFKLGARINVQLTSISQRKHGITRGSKRLPAGRKPNGEHHVTNQTVKHVHNHSKNNENNGRN